MWYSTKYLQKSLSFPQFLSFSVPSNPSLVHLVSALITFFFARPFTLSSMCGTHAKPPFTKGLDYSLSSIFGSSLDFASQSCLRKRNQAWFKLANFILLKKRCIHHCPTPAQSHPYLLVTFHPCPVTDKCSCIWPYHCHSPKKFWRPPSAQILLACFQIF